MDEIKEFGAGGEDFDWREETMDDPQEPTPKERFQGLVAQLNAMLARIDAVYPQMIAAAEPHDRELARRLEASMRADRELLQHVRSKTEAGGSLPAGVSSLLLGR